jgi:hypothetical protein
MDKRRILRSFWLRISLEVLLLWAVIVALVWLLYSQVTSLQRFYFSDVLFIVGALECAIASGGLFGRPFEITGGPQYGAPALPVQSSEEERRMQALANFVQQRTFGIRLFAIGLLTILLSIVMTFFFPLIKATN